MTQRKKRKPDLSKIRTTQVYTVADFAQELDRRKETVLRWIKDGMPILDGRKPYLIDGAEAKAWLKEKWQKRKSSCCLDEIYCAPCHSKKHPASDSVTFSQRPCGTFKVEGDCPDCGARMHIIRSHKDIEEIRTLMSRFTTNVEHLSGYRNPNANRLLNTDSIQSLKIGGKKQ